jgi:hypothetical protein
MKNEYPLQSILYTVAGDAGHFHILEWLYTYGIPFDDNITRGICDFHGAYLDRWCHDNECNIFTLLNFIRFSDETFIQVVKWLIERGCPIQYDVCIPNISMCGYDVEPLISLQKKEKMREVWERYTHGEFESYAEWPPEEVMSDIYDYIKNEIMH